MTNEAPKSLAEELGQFILDAIANAPILERMAARGDDAALTYTITALDPSGGTVSTTSFTEADASGLAGLRFAAAQARAGKEVLAQPGCKIEITSDAR